jgi:hypothetical protein
MRILGTPPRTGFQPLRTASAPTWYCWLARSHWVCGSLRIADGGSLDASLREGQIAGAFRRLPPHAHAPQRVEIQLGALAAEGPASNATRNGR